jgi:hypothetical protein
VRLLASALSVVLLIVCSSAASTDFSGTWALDLKASTSPESLLKRLQIPLIQRRLAARMKIEAVYKQSPKLLVIFSQGSGFSRTEQIRLSGPPESRTEAMTGPYTIQTRWSADGAQLVSTYHFRLKDGETASLVIKRKLTDAGSTLVLDGAMHVEGEPQKWTVQRVWRKSVRG